MAKGRKTHLNIGGQIVPVQKLFGKPQLDSIYYSDEKYVTGQDLDSAFYEVRKQIQTSKKWSGIRHTKVDHTSNPANESSD